MDLAQSHTHKTHKHTKRDTNKQKKDERSRSTVMPRCLMATFSTMKEIGGDEGGRLERGVSRNRGLPRNPRIGPSSS